MTRPHDIAGKDKLYAKYKKGDVGSLIDLLEAEREGLYDFLLRMTGQISRSMDTVDEVFQSLNEDVLEAVDSYSQLRVLLYTTARKFNADIWNAATSKLVNTVLENPPGVNGDRPLTDLPIFLSVDRQLRLLAGAEREAVILTAVRGFPPTDAAEIMGASEEQLVRLAQAGLGQFASTGSLATVGITEALTGLPLHVAPPRSSQATVNLSLVMQDIKTRPAGLWSPARIAFLLLLSLLTIVGILYVFRPDVIAEAERLLRRESESSGDIKLPNPAPPPVNSNVPRPSR